MGHIDIHLLHRLGKRGKHVTRVLRHEDDALEARISSEFPLSLRHSEEEFVFSTCAPSTRQVINPPEWDAAPHATRITAGSMHPPRSPTRTYIRVHTRMHACIHTYIHVNTSQYPPAGTSSTPHGCCACEGVGSPSTIVMVYLHPDRHEQ